MSEPLQEETIDTILYPQLKIIQKKKGYRFSLDSILLANFVRPKQRDRVIDLGTGSGVIPIILAFRYKLNKKQVPEIVGVEVQKGLAKMAKRNVELNNLKNYISIIRIDLRSLKDVYPTSSFDFALSNPPYLPLKCGRLSPTPERLIARHEVMATLSDIISISQYLLKEKGILSLVYPASRLAELVALLREGSFEPIRLRMVHPSISSEANLVLIDAIRLRRKALPAARQGSYKLNVMQPLIIYNSRGEYTQEMKKIFETNPKK